MTEHLTTSTLRCFAAFPSPIAGASQVLTSNLERLARIEKFKLRLVPSENLHITAKFIGTVEADQVGLLDSILRDQSAKQDRFHLNCRGIGFFDNALYIAIEENEILSQFVSNLNQAFTFLGYSIESMKFVPHITLARFEPSAKNELAKELDTFRDHEWGELPVESIHLFRSETLSSGAKYTSIANHLLSG